MSVNKQSVPHQISALYNVPGNMNIGSKWRRPYVRQPVTLGMHEETFIFVSHKLSLSYVTLIELCLELPESWRNSIALYLFISRI